MGKALLFIPDISGFTEFIHTTEVEHSQHVIAEILELLIDANITELKLAEVEGDALFFYKESLPTAEELYLQIEQMFKLFNNHLKQFEENTICPCHACATAPKLELKIVIHAGDLQFIEVKGARKPFGQEVIQVHRLLKNSINSNNYVLISSELDRLLEMSSLTHPVFSFQEHKEVYDFGTILMKYATVNLTDFLVDENPSVADGILANPNITSLEKFDLSANRLYELISNFKYRSYWTEGVDEFKYDPEEVNRIGTEHICVINKSKLNFTTISKPGKPGQLIYGEHTFDPPIVKEIYNFYIITPLSSNSCSLLIESYIKTNNIFQLLIFKLILKRFFNKNIQTSLIGLKRLETIELEKSNKI